jgi:hypothetical protein
MYAASRQNHQTHLDTHVSSSSHYTSSSTVLSIRHTKTHVPNLQPQRQVDGVRSTLI